MDGYWILWRVVVPTVGGAAMLLLWVIMLGLAGHGKPRMLDILKKHEISPIALTYYSITTLAVACSTPGKISWRPIALGALCLLFYAAVSQVDQQSGKRFLLRTWIASVVLAGFSAFVAYNIEHSDRPQTVNDVANAGKLAKKGKI